MNKTLGNVLGGFAGALALNIVHQAFKKFVTSAPRVDLLGEEALSKGLQGMGITPPTGHRLFVWTLAGDLISNTFYYSAIGVGHDHFLLPRGVAVGFLAGIGAVHLPEPLHLHREPVARTQTTRLLTTTWYVLGGIVTAAVIKALRKASST